MRDARQNRSNRPLQVESLESMTLLSGVTAMAARSHVHVSPTPAIATVIDLDGTASGSYTSKRKVPDTGTTETLTRIPGTFPQYGAGTVTGTLHTPGLILNGKATGTLTVALPRGTVTLSLLSTNRKAFSDLPKTFAFVITKGTGDYQHPTGKGTVDVAAKPASSLSPFSGHGQITLTFHSKNTPVL